MCVLSSCADDAQTLVPTSILVRLALAEASRDEKASTIQLPTRNDGTYNSGRTDVGSTTSKTEEVYEMSNKVRGRTLISNSHIYHSTISRAPTRQLSSGPRFPSRSGRGPWGLGK